MGHWPGLDVTLDALAKIMPFCFFLQDVGYNSAEYVIMYTKQIPAIHASCKLSFFLATREWIDISRSHLIDSILARSLGS
jgi:hypothetical protein